MSRTKEEQRAYNREYYLRNRDKCLIKNNLSAKSRYERTRDAKRIEERKTYRKWKAAHPLNLNYQAAKHRAKVAGIEFTIRIEDLSIPEYCPIFPEIKIEAGGDRWNSPSLDRKDNSKGYTPENTFVVSHFGNMRKSAMSIKDVENLLQYMKS